MNITATISWSLIWSVYSNLICLDSGLMRARWPWAGYYEVSPTIWLQAHWGQFVQVGGVRWGSPVPSRALSARRPAFAAGLALPARPGWR